MTTQPRLLARRSMSPSRMSLMQRGPIKLENSTHSNADNDKISGNQKQYDNNIKSQVNFNLNQQQRWGSGKLSNKIEPRLPMGDRAAETNFDLDGTRRYDQQLNKFLKSLEKTANTVDNGKSGSPQLTDDSQSLSVFSLSSDETFNRKSEPKKKVSYLKSIVVKDELPVESKTLSNVGANSRISSALLKAQQFSSKYKQLKEAQSADKKQYDAKKVAIKEDEELDSEEIMKSSEDYEPSQHTDGSNQEVFEQNENNDKEDQAKDKFADLDPQPSSSSTISSIKSLMNVKDLLLDLPSTSPESKNDAKLDEVKQMSSVSEKSESDFAVTSESAIYESEIRNSEAMKNSALSDNSISRTNKTVSKSKRSYESDFEETEVSDGATLNSATESTLESAQHPESTLTSESSEALTESETVISAPKVPSKKPPRKTFPSELRKMKIPNEAAKVSDQKSRSTQTMTNGEYNIHRFYNDHMHSSAMLARPVIYYVDPRVIVPNIINNEMSNLNVALVDDLLKQEMLNIRYNIESHSRNYVTAVSTLKPTYKYTTWENTKKMIEKQLQKNEKTKIVK